MRHLLLFLAFLVILNLYLYRCSKIYAVENPLEKPNNRFGIHILFPEEIIDAAKLINSSGGDWGYVTIPIQAGDRNLLKWQKFMDLAKELHVIPIIRLATEGDYFNSKVWRKPNAYDIVDFANFLNSIVWPVKNKYIVVFNEVNRADEWGGEVSPNEYADLLHFTVQTFKSRNENFFIISSGFDNASANTDTSLDEYTFINKMYLSFPEVFSEIDGFSSHSYPNPGFIQPPTVKTAHSITSFIHEKAYIKSLSGSDLPVFITETGWIKNKIQEQTISLYLSQAFESIWNDSVVAVTPFLLKAGGEPFEKFSFLSPDNSPTVISLAYQNISKTKGKPNLEEKILGKATSIFTDTQAKTFKPTISAQESISLDNSVKILFKWLLKL